MAKILILNGPNLNLLGTREPEKYGVQTLDQINKKLSEIAQTAGHQIQAFQSNSEHSLIDLIHSAPDSGIDFIIFNPGAFTHTSIALRDALLAVDIAFIEVHMSNVHAREEFRRLSYFSDIAQGVICGFGSSSYEFALHAVLSNLEN
jgi:3-dehydroquinate dehydratase-2